MKTAIPSRVELDSFSFEDVDSAPQIIALSEIRDVFIYGKFFRFSQVRKVDYDELIIPWSSPNNDP